MARVTGTKNITPSGDTLTFGNGQIKVNGAANVTNPYGYVYNPLNIFGSTLQRTAGGAYFAGGVGIEKDLNVGGYIYGRIALANTSSQLVIEATNTNIEYYPIFAQNIQGGGGGSGTYLYGDEATPGQVGLKYNPALGRLTLDTIYVASTTTSNTWTAGAVIVNGSVGITGNVNVGSSIVVGGVSTATTSTGLLPKYDGFYTIGSENNKWAESYLNKIYTKILGSTSSDNITMVPGNGTVEIQGDIRVIGQTPIGTAPVVTNILYVTMDGNDTNDGRAMDSSRACRTIGGALNSPYYQPGTQIRVAPGHYLEDNPLRLKPYTSIMGSDIRTTGIEPINKTQDLFHLDSGCYLAFMQFLNGRSGLLEGPYVDRFNRGAYCTAFPPLEGNDRIDLYHSPYIQNCTNLTGPWLKDGTLFVPNQTVQVPTAIGTGTWIKNTSSISVYVNSGTISVGMAINAGPQNPGFFNARTLLLANKKFLQEQVVEYVNITYPGFDYNRQKCFRDVGILVENVAYDASFGGNEKSIQSGLAYYDGVVSLIAGQETQTVGAIEYLNSLTNQIVVNSTCTDLLLGTGTTQVINIVLTGGEISTASYNTLFSTITNIIVSGPGAAPDEFKSPGPDAAFVSAEILMQANRTFIQENVVEYVESIKTPGFVYDQAKCYRDVGLIIDAVSQDILLGGNSKSIEAGLAYWTNGYNSVQGQITTTTMAIQRASDIALEVIANTPSILSTTGTQIINTFFQYGGDYMPQQAVARNFNIINTIIQNGVAYAPPVYQGGGIQALTGINGLDTKESTTVTSVASGLAPNEYIVGLSTSTIGFGSNATLYFGNTTVFPYRNSEVEEYSYNLTGNTSTFDLRKVDPIGGMGGSLVDGAVISDRSPIQSFVYDAFTQLTQGGRGIRITNNGYAQLVSVFTIFPSVGVQVDNGGIASIVNSNANFGDISLLAKGFGSRKFSGTIYNPSFKAFNASTGALDPTLDAYYPNGFWPTAASVLIFNPDVEDRPHISLVMEVVPPEGHLNEQQLPGFLAANVNTGTLSTGSIVITGIDTDGIAIGHSLYVRNQYGFTTGSNGISYVDTGTVVTDIGYQSVTLNKALLNGGGDPENISSFNLYFCGNNYYTVLSSTVAPNPKPEGINILSTASTGLTVSQVPSHKATLDFLNTMTIGVITNTVLTPHPSNTSTVQTLLPLVTGGGSAQTFIDNKFTIITSILTATNITSANAVVPSTSRTKKGTITTGAGSAITLIEENIEFLADEASLYAEDWAAINEPTLTFTDFIREKCQRDVKLILQRLVYDLSNGGNYNSVMTGLSYWSRAGTHHVVKIGENVRRTDLFPDGATVNFYQRSYISASGYVFEYVGAGTDYGALPQRGIADPVQGKEVVQLGEGKIFYTSTDQNGDFRIGPGLVISQATGVLSGRTFSKSLFANMTPFILAIEGTG